MAIVRCIAHNKKIKHKKQSIVSKKKTIKTKTKRTNSFLDSKHDYKFLFFRVFFFSCKLNQNKLELLNQRAQELIRQADSVNHTQIDEETTQLNDTWNKKLDELQSHTETLTGLCGHWQDFEKRIEQFENQLTRLDERNRNIDTAIKSKQHLDDTKHIYQVSDCHYVILYGMPSEFSFFILATNESKIFIIKIHLMLTSTHLIHFAVRFPSIYTISILSLF